MELGEGDGSFEPFNSELEAMMIHGPQGGWHILGSFVLRNALQILDVEFTIEHLPTATLISDNSYRLAMIMDGECSGFYPGLYGYINVIPLEHEGLNEPHQLIAYDPLLMTMRTNDCGAQQQSEGVCTREDRWVEKQLQVIAVPDPVDVE